MKIGVALASGGARGFAHLGVLEVLEREQIPIDILTGSSVGAVMASMYAFRPKVQPSITQCRNYLQSSLYDNTKLSYFNSYEQGAQSVYDKLKIKFSRGAVFTASLSKTSLFDMDMLQKNIEFLIPAVNVEEAIIDLGIVVFDLDSGDEILLRKGPLVQAAMASAAIPGIFPPIPGDHFNLDEKMMLMDGGIVNPIPVDHAYDMGADLVIAVDLCPQPEKMSPPTNTYEVAMRAADISRHKLKNHVVKQADVVVEVETSDHFWADFSMLEESIDLGRKAAEKAMPSIKAAMSEYHKKHALKKKVHLGVANLSPLETESE